MASKISSYDHKTFKGRDRERTLWKVNDIIEIIKDLAQKTIGSLCGTRSYLAWPEGQEMGICV